ncbi:MAG: transposase [Proteobacteria bacterium]|nr:transposase [Pseudomonadota bacterium]
MARSIRLDYSDTFYHVLSRGNERRAIFRDREDYLRFLDILGKTVKRYKLEVHAYVLMDNHYHLLVRTREANLSRAIQWLGVSYAVWFNRKHNRSGHLFQGRFKSFLVEDERYFTAMCFYIHGNPLRAGIVQKLLDYKWSSYRAYADEEYQISWLTTDLVLGMYGGSRKRFCEAQQSCHGKENELFNNLRYGLYLGSEEFAEECLKKVKKDDNREKPQVRSLLKGRDIRPIAFHVLRSLGDKEPDSVMVSRRRTRRPNRDIAIYILSYLGIYTNKVIGEVFGVGYTAVTEAYKRGERYLEEDGQLRETVQRIINDL